MSQVTYHISGVTDYMSGFIGSKGTANFVNGGIIPRGGVASRRVAAFQSWMVYYLVTQVLTLLLVEQPQLHWVCNREA